MGHWTVTKPLGKLSVYLVYDQNYQVVGVASGERTSVTKFADQPITVIGPVEVDSPINWGTVQEEQFGPNLGGVAPYVNLKDGVPLPPQSTYEDFGHPTH